MHAGRLLAVGFFASFLLFGDAAPVGAAVAIHQYQITAGTSSGALNIGTVTGGSFKVRYTNAPTCGIFPATCPATLLSGSITGSLGMLAFGAPTLAALNQSFGQHNSSAQGAAWSRPDPTPPTIGGSYGVVQSQFTGPPGTRLYAAFYANPGGVNGALTLVNYRLHCTGGLFCASGGYGPFGPGALLPLYTAGLGNLSFTGQEVAVPEPAVGSFLFTGSIMLGMHGYRRIRRRRMG